jgi:predicted phosphodiesterase
MRYGLISDIHANLAALRAALAFLERMAVDAYLCPGDVVGYGPQPNECVAVMASLPLHCAAGNHDLIATGQLSDAGTGALARRTLAWTRAALDADARAWLAALPPCAVVPGVVVAHGALGDPRRYVSTDAQAAEQLAQLPQEHADSVLVLGHTHRAAAFGSRSGRALNGVPATVRLEDGERWMVNPGAVGQSRERAIDVRVAVLDLDRRSVSFHALPYDFAATRAELRRRGLPVRAVHLPPPRGARALLRRLASARPQQI